MKEIFVYSKLIVMTPCMTPAYETAHITITFVIFVNTALQDKCHFKIKLKKIKPANFAVF